MCVENMDKKEREKFDDQLDGIAYSTPDTDAFKDERRAIAERLRGK